ncbi:MAG: cadherin-like domain-containing protein, partial [Gammaproteobacteria bacterium]
PVLRTILTVTNGTLSLATTAGLTSVTGDGTGTVIVIGAESDINTALDGLTYAPTNNYSGPADLTVTTDLQADLLGFYEFEINGDIGDDTSPNGTNDGTVVGATQIIDGTRGNVLHLDGIDDVITIPGTFGDPQNLTLAAWVQLDAASGSSEVISLGNRVILRLDETFSGLGVFGSFYDGSSYLTTSSGTFIAGDGWHHVAYTLDGTTNEQTLYIDGLAVDTTNHANAVVYAGGSSALGRHASSASYFLEGEMDDARIYDRALGASEIQALAIDQFSDTETVSITVDPANDMPTTTPVVLAPIAEDSGVRLITQAQLLVNANDDDGDPLTAASLAISAGSGTLFDNGDGTWNYTPALNDDSSVSFSYTISDGIAAPIAASASLDITPLNDAPTATNLSSTSAYNEGDASVAITDIVVSDIDAGETITATLTLADTATGSLSANDGATYTAGTGVWTITGSVAQVNTALANLVFNPTVNNEVDTSIDVNIDDGDEDGSGALTGIITLDVTPVNDAPTATNLASGSTYNQGDASLPLNDIVISDVDSGETVTATLTLANVSTGSLSANDGATYNATTGVWTITGSVAQVNVALANLEFNPTANNTLDTTVAISIDDGDEDSSGPLLGAMSITVNPLPVVEPPVDPPIIESEPDDPVEIPETEPPVEAPVEEVVVELPKDNPLLVVGSGPVIPDVSDDPAPSLLADSVVEFIDPDARVDNSEVPRETSVTKPVGVETLLIKLREQLEFFDDPMQLIGAESFITRLNDMREALVSETENTEKVIGSSLTVTAGFSVGYVVWLARSGVLLSSVLSSLPAWRFIDPLPVLAGLQGGKGDDDEESLESMVEEKPVDDASQDAAGDDKSDA